MENFGDWHVESSETKISSDRPLSGVVGDLSAGGGLGKAAEAGLSRRAKSSLRLKYEAESHVIEKKLGSLEAIRERLGLSQRKMAQLLLVDPSAWTRWTKGQDQAPPHIYRMLQWYLALEEKYPALDVNFWLNTVSQVTEKSAGSSEALAETLDELAAARKKIEEFEARHVRDARAYDERLQKLEIAHSQPVPKTAQVPRRLLWMGVGAALAGGAVGFALASYLR